MFSYYDQLRPAAQYAADGSLIATFFDDDCDHLAAITKGANTYAVITDQVGSPTLIVDAISGAVAQQISYDPFGTIMADSNPGFQPFGFLGGLADPDTKLVHLGARDYDPALGRLIS